MNAASEENDWELEQSLLRSATAQVEEGGEAHVVFGSAQRSTLKLAGVVRRGQAPAAFVRVRAVLADAADERDAALAISDATGRFELLLHAAGNYRVEARSGGYNSIAAVRAVDVPPGGRIEVRTEHPRRWISDVFNFRKTTTAVASQSRKSSRVGRR